MRTREAQRAIRKGIKFLDSEIPKWRRLIDRDDLDLSDPRNCIMGQIFGDYDRGRDILGLDLEESEAMGFGLHDAKMDDADKYESEYYWLTDLWKGIL